MKKNMRDDVARRCQQVLQIATKSADANRESVYSAYSWARTVFYGMGETFYLLDEMELYYLVEYYHTVADNKIHKALFK